LTEEQILAWADAHHVREGRWPAEASGSVLDAPDEKWTNISAALQQGLRGLPGGSSLAQLLAEKRGATHHLILPKLTEEVILSWADAHYGRKNEWPRIDSGEIEDAPGESWKSIDADLRRGLRGLPSGSSLPKLLADARGVRNHLDLSDLTVQQIIAWADAYHQATDKWPVRDSGAIQDAPDEKWANIDVALNNGRRGLPGGSSLAQLLAEFRGVRNKQGLPSLSLDQILFWADAHRNDTGDWPTMKSGPVRGTDETWSGVNSALYVGLRGLSGGSSLANLLAEHRGVRNVNDLSPLTEEQILRWADAHFAQTGQWPERPTGPILDAPGETWSGISSALSAGLRGLSGGSSLARLLAQHRSVRNLKALQPLTEEQILAWADEHHARTGEWPRHVSGSIHAAPGETWKGVEHSLRLGSRGLAGGSSLAKLIEEKRGVRNPQNVPLLTEEEILTWADAHHKSTGNWPNGTAGPILVRPGETWTAVNIALVRGTRGLKGGSSLAKLLAKERGVRNIHDLPPFLHFPTKS
jgi:pyrroloquinoline quinone (PQQ) biosynthesis protein C